MNGIRRINFTLIMFLGISCALLSSCGTMKIYVNDNNTYSKKIPITINELSDDESGTLGELQFLLHSNGYNLMSYEAAEEALISDTESRESMLHGKTGAPKSFDSVYVLNLNYSFYKFTYYFAYTYFSANITNLETGEILMTSSFRGDKSCSVILKELVNKMNSFMK